MSIKSDFTVLNINPYEHFSLEVKSPLESGHIRSPCEPRKLLSEKRVLSKFI